MLFFLMFVANLLDTVAFFPNVLELEKNRLSVGNRANTQYTGTMDDTTCSCMV
jgi:hypothetical protein